MAAHRPDSVAFRPFLDPSPDCRKLHWPRGSSNFKLERAPRAAGHSRPGSIITLLIVFVWPGLERLGPLSIRVKTAFLGQQFRPAIVASSRLIVGKYAAYRGPVIVTGVRFVQRQNAL